MSRIVSELETIIQNLQELQRMHQLNLELIEYFGVWLEWIRKNDVPVPDKEKFYSFVSKTRALIHEIYSGLSSKTVIYRKLSDGSYHDDKSNGKLPEPCIESLLGS